MSAKPNRRKNVSKNYTNQTMVFGAKNYRFLIIAVLLLAVGFGGMYIENEFLGFFSLYISPLLLIGGFITVVYAILVKHENMPETEDTL